jgi:hypothetical protein
MRVKIKGSSPLVGIDKIWRAGRAFSVTEAREVEIVDQDDDPPPVISVRVNPTTGGKMRVESPDPDVMGRVSYKAICDDSRFSVFQTGDVDSSIANAQVTAARSAVTDLSTKLQDATVRIAELEAANAKLTADLAHIADLEASSALKAKADDHDAKGKHHYDKAGNKGAGKASA